MTKGGISSTCFRKTKLLCFLFLQRRLFPRRRLEIELGLGVVDHQFLQLPLQLQAEVDAHMATIAFLKRRYDQPDNYEGITAWVEEHFAEGGLGTLVTEEVSDMRNVVVKRIGLPHTFATTSGNYRELIAYYKLDGAGIAETVKECLKG